MRLRFGMHLITAAGGKVAEQRLLALNKMDQIR